MNFPVTSDGITPLMLACSFGNKIIMQVIIKNKMTEKDIRDKEGFNALYYATFYGHTHIITELGKREVPYVESNEGTTCLHVAAKNGYFEVAEIFLKFKEMFIWKLNHPWDNKIDVNARKKHKKGLGVTPAFLAAKNGSIEVFQLLHEHGATIENLKCAIGGNQDLEPIHIACKEGNFLVVQYILSKSVNMAANVKIRI
jgi:ankyrin repeat protein